MRPAPVLMGVKVYNHAMSSTLTSSSPARQAFLGGLLIAVIGAILFSAKAIVAKLMYRYHVDAVMVLTLRMIFAFPMLG